MDNKNLNIRYFFYFIISFFLIIFIIDFLKERDSTISLQNYKNTLNKEYSKYYQSYKNVTELIYFNEFIKEKKILEILKNDHNENINYLKDELYLNFEKNFIFYKTLDLTEISFYDSSNNLILSMNNNFKDNFTSKIVEETITNKKESSNFRIDNEKIFLFFSKPIFDENLDFIAVMNFEFDLNSLIKKLEKDSDFKFRYLLSNNFDLNEKFFFNMKENQRKELRVDINNKKEKSLVLNEDLIKIPVFFLPIFSSDFYKNNIYLLAYNLNKNNDLAKINYYFDDFFILMIFFLVFLTYLLYRSNNLKVQRDLINKKYEELFNNVNEYIMKVETDLEGNITFATKPFYKLSGYTESEILGKNINILKHPDVSDIFFEKLWEELRTNKIWKGEIKNQDKFGNSYWIKAIIFPIYSVNNEIEGYSSIRINITDTKQLEKINRLLKEDLSNKLNDIKTKDKTLVDTTKVQLMSKILDSLSHQWKIPIKKISFELQKLIDINNKFEAKSIISIETNIKTELKNLSYMLNEIKYLFNTRKSEKSNLLSVTSEVIYFLKDEFNKNNIKVKFDIKPDIFMSIQFIELKNILINIFKNCIELSSLDDSQQVTIFVSVISEDGNKDVIIKIEDNIKGENKKDMVDQMLSSVEEKYFDTNLYLSKLFIEKNRGLFWYSNTLHNTIYYIKLDKEV